MGCERDLLNYFYHITWFDYPEMYNCFCLASSVVHQCTPNCPFSKKQKSAIFLVACDLTKGILTGEIILFKVVIVYLSLYTISAVTESFSLECL